MKQADSGVLMLFKPGLHACQIQGVSSGQPLFGYYYLLHIVEAVRGRAQQTCTSLLFLIHHGGRLCFSSPLLLLLWFIDSTN